MPIEIARGRPVRKLAVVGFLIGSLVLVGVLSAQPGRKLTRTEVTSHVLTRLAFGPEPGQVNEVSREGWQRWIEQQLSPDSIADDSLDKVVAKKCPSLAMDLTALQQLDNDKDRGRIKDELREAVLLRAVHSKRQFQEVIVDFWRNHLNVDVNKVPFLATHYEEHVLRKHAFGKFEDLLLASARHPAMLVYLDNFVSNKQGLNENYARELMELHTLGADNYYKQPDVIALARTLTGWTCGWQNDAGGAKEYRFFYNPQMHDSSVVNVVGLDIQGDGGMADGEKAIRYLANHEGAARFICTKLCRYLINDTPSPALLDRVIAVYSKTGGDLKEVYRAIIFSPDFLDAKNFRAKFKTPFEYTISALRAADAQIDSPQQIFRELKLMGQPIYECEDPPGYSDQREAWLDPGIMVYRWNFAIALVTEKVQGVRIGQDFIAQVGKTPPAFRAQKIMQMVLPGMSDTKTFSMAARTNDPRAMVAWALGSASFQQQ